MLASKLWEKKYCFFFSFCCFFPPLSVRLFFFFAPKMAAVMWGTSECQRSHLVVDGWEQAIRGAHILWPSARESRYLLRSDTDTRAEGEPLLQRVGRVTKWWTPHFAKTWAHRWQLLAQVHLWVFILLNSIFVSLCEFVLPVPRTCTIIPFLLPAWNSQHFDFGEILRKPLSSPFSSPDAVGGFKRLCGRIYSVPNTLP